jgi:hypothetical protein
MILQLSQSRFTEGRTFIQISSSGDKKTQPEEILSQERFSLKITSLLPEGYPAFRQVVRGHFYHNFVSWQDPNEMQSHFSRDMSQNPMSVG